MQHFTKNWACDRFVEKTAPSSQRLYETVVVLDDQMTGSMDPCNYVSS